MKFDEKQEKILASVLALLGPQTYALPVMLDKGAHLTPVYKARVEPEYKGRGMTEQEFRQLPTKLQAAHILTRIVC